MQNVQRWLQPSEIFIGVGAGDLQHGRVAGANLLLPGAQTAGHHDLAVLLQRLADGVERLLDRRVDKAAGVDHDQIGILVGRHQIIALRPQPGQDAFAVDQGLGTTETDETDAGSTHERVT